MIHEKDLRKLAVNLTLHQNGIHSAAVDLYNNLPFTHNSKQH